MPDQRHDVPVPDPLVGRRRSRVDAFMPLSSLEGLRAATPADPVRDDRSASAGGPVTLDGCCRLYRLSGAGVRLRKAGKGEAI